MRYHGVDLHKKCVTVSMRNEEGTEEKFVRAQMDIKSYVASLGSQDSVVLEAAKEGSYAVHARAVHITMSCLMGGASRTSTDPVPSSALTSRRFGRQ
jgi:hypothetical protein